MVQAVDIAQIAAMKSKFKALLLLQFSLWEAVRCSAVKQKVYFLFHLFHNNILKITCFFGVAYGNSDISCFV